MTRGTLPDFSGVYDNMLDLAERVEAQGLKAIRDGWLFGHQVLLIGGDDRKDMYLAEYLPGGRVFLTDNRIGHNTLRFAEGLKGGAS